MKQGRAQTPEDGETWGEGEVMPTLNAFDVGDVRTTAAIVEPSGQTPFRRVRNASGPDDADRWAEDEVAATVRGQHGESRVHDVVVDDRVMGSLREHVRPGSNTDYTVVEVAPTLTAPDNRRRDVDGRRQDGSRTDSIPVVVQDDPGCPLCGHSWAEAGIPNDDGFPPLCTADSPVDEDDAWDEDREVCGCQFDPPPELAPTLRVGPATPADGGPGDTVPIIAQDRSPALRAQSQSSHAEDQEAFVATAVNTEDDPLLPLGLDSHRYRCCGNGVVSQVSEWIGLRLAGAV